MTGRRLKAGTILVLAQFAPTLPAAETFSPASSLVLPLTEHDPVILHTGYRGDVINPSAFQVFVDNQEISRPMVGSLTSTENAIQFMPRFSFREETPYRVELSPDCLHAKKCTSEENQIFRFRISRSPDGTSTGEITVEPAVGTWPANILRLYLNFPVPMAQGDVYRHISIEDVTGRKIGSPFLNLARGLWNNAQTRLTVLFDPGRLKSGVGPNSEYGAPLEPGKQYTLRVSGNMLDAKGNRLGKDRIWKFRTSASVVKRLDITSWTIAEPEAGSKMPVTVATGALLDAVNAFKRLAVVGPQGERIEGKLDLVTNPNGWLFSPTKPWESGVYEIHVDMTIEDVSGNSAQTPFELQGGRTRAFERPVAKLVFAVN